MARARLAVALAAAVLPLVNACGKGEGLLDTKTTVEALRKAGFRNLVVRSNAEALKKAARELERPDLARDPLDYDLILPRGRSVTLMSIPVMAIRLPTVGLAKQRYRNDRPLIEGEIPDEWLPHLPRGFDPSRFREERVCNVVVNSYNARNEAALDRRFEKAVELLREACD